MCAQLEKLTDYMNEVGAKTRFLHAKIERNPRADEEGEPTLWTVLAELKTDFKTMGLALQKIPPSLHHAWNTLSEHKLGMDHMQANMTSIYNNYNKQLVTSNQRLILLEKTSSAQIHAPLPQAQDGVFNFGTSNNVASGDAFQEKKAL